MLRSLLILIIFIFYIYSQECTNSLQPCDDACYYHGVCLEDGSCVCNEGWEGSDCSIPTCNTCEHGNCLDIGGCDCFYGYSGDNCDIPICIGPNDCCNLEGYCSDEDKLPDLIINEDAISAFLSIEEFDICDCAVTEGCISSGKRILLRFNTDTRNIGDADLQIGHPGDNLELWEYHVCHGHSHFVDFVDFRLLSGGQVVQSQKSGFCIVDSFPFIESGPKFYSCNGAQGLQKGWSDFYGSHLDCQWLDLTGLDGALDWTLEIEVNPDGILPESSSSNNIISIDLTCDNNCNNPGVSRCIFGQCICYNDIDSAHCTYIPNWDESLITYSTISESSSSFSNPNSNSDSSSTSDGLILSSNILGITILLVTLFF